MFWPVVLGVNQLVRPAMLIVAKHYQAVRARRKHKLLTDIDDFYQHNN